MILLGKMYHLLKKLNALSGEDVQTQSTQGKLEEIQENLVNAHEKYVKQYNTRSKMRNFSVGQEVYRRNFILSDAGEKKCKKFAKKFLKCRIRSQKATNLYELEDLTGKLIGVFHAKDIILS